MTSLVRITTIAEADAMLVIATEAQAKYINRLSFLENQLVNSQDSTSNYQTQVEQLQTLIATLDSFMAVNGPNPIKSASKLKAQSDLDKLQLENGQLDLDGYQSTLEQIEMAQVSNDSYNEYIAALKAKKATLTA
jgi:hypothetical protein